RMKNSLIGLLFFLIGSPPLNEDIHRVESGEIKKIKGWGDGSVTPHHAPLEPGERTAAGGRETPKKPQVLATATLFVETIGFDDKISFRFQWDPGPSFYTHIPKTMALIHMEDTL